MRLLAHGGNEYAERRRIGSWTSIAVGTLEDVYGLSGHDLSFGCGVQENALVLIIRQAQKQGQRLYAYSLLLDPGDDVWRRFGWNVASLVLALFGGVEPGEAAPDCLGQQLLERPESFNEESLVAGVESLRPPTLSAAALSDLPALWVGAIYSSEPITVAPQSIGLAARPRITEMAAALATLPPSFRAGRGWLVGGSAIHSRTFGAQLVLDDWLTGGTADVQEHINRGELYGAAWKTLARHARYAPVIGKKLDAPIWTWEAPWANNQDPARAFERVYYLAEILESDAPDATIAKIQLDLDEAGPLEQEIREALHLRVVSSAGLINGNLTRLLLRDHFDKGLKLAQAEAARLDEEAVVEFYTKERRLRPLPENGSPPLGAELRFKLWNKLVQTEETASVLPALLESAWQDLRATNVRSRFAEIVETTLTRALSLTQSLQMWVGYRDHNILGPLISERLEAKLWEQAPTASGNWPHDYLAFGRDAGGKRLAEANLSLKSVQALVAEMIRLATPGGNLSDRERLLSEDARQWLDQLATSLLRTQLPVRDKLAISDLSLAGWQNFCRMFELYAGNDQTNPKASLTELERENLLGELIELTDLPFRKAFVPNLRGLNTFLGGLSDEVVVKLAKLRPSLRDHDITGWLEGWERLRPDDIYQDELIRQIMQSDAKFQIPALLRKLNDEKRAELFRQLLFANSTSTLSDEVIAKRFEKFLDYAMEDAALAERIAVAFKACESKEQHALRDVFFYRYCHSSKILDKLLPCLDEESHYSVVLIMFRRNFTRLEEDAVRYYCESGGGDESSLKLSFKLTPLKRAVLSFVLSAEGTPLKETIVRDTHKRNAAPVERHLRELLRLSGKETKRLLSPKPVKYSHEIEESSKRWWQFWK
jgi:hypothetical protein